MLSSTRDCVSCKKLLVPPTANFCAHCGFPQHGHSSKQEDAPTTELCCLMLQDLEIENDKKQQKQLSPNLPKVLLPVLNVPREKSMKVQFNAVIPLTLWEWEEAESSVYMRFGHRDIGSWKRDIGPCTLFRGVGNGLFVVEHKISLDYEFLKDINQNGLSYKYVVYSPRSNSIGHQFEFLHGAPPCESIENNRLLRIPQDKLEPGGYYRQFDTVILPHVKSNEAKSTDNEWWKSFDSSNSLAFVIPSPAIMRSLCMEVHLHALKGIIIRGIFSEDFSIQNALAAFQGLLNCICVQWIEYKGEEKKWVEGLDIFIKKWFESVVHTLLTTNTLQSQHRVVSGILTAVCLKNVMEMEYCSMNITANMKIHLLQAMSLSITNGKEELQFLQRMIKTPEIKKIILDVLLYYLKVDLKEDMHVITVINALPLYHFLSGLSVPNQISLKKSPCILDLTTLAPLFENSPSFFETCCTAIFQLFHFDSQILILIPYITNQKDPNFYCEALPIEISITWLRNLQSDIPKNFLQSISGEKLEHDFVRPMTCILQRIFTVEITKFPILSCYFEAAMYLVETFKTNLDGSKNSELLVASIVSLLLHILYRAKRVDEETNDQWNLCQLLRYSTSEFLREWVMRPNVIGGFFFGGEVKYSGTNFQELDKKEQELKFWEAILSLEFPAKDMKNELEALVLSIFGDRISNIPITHLIIDAFVCVETQKGIHDSLRSIVFVKTCDVLGLALSSKVNTDIEPSPNLVVQLILGLADKKHSILSHIILFPALSNHLIDQTNLDGTKSSEPALEKIAVKQNIFENSRNGYGNIEMNDQNEVDAVREVVCIKSKSHIDEFVTVVPNLPMTQLEALAPSSRNPIIVQFNAVIQKDIWKWEEGKSSIYMRFGYKIMGDWKVDIGPCILHRDAGEGIYAVRYSISFNCKFMKLLKIGLPYKYVVYSPLIKTTKHQYEYLHHGAPPYQGSNTNRLLKVPEEKLGPGGYYRQFDTMILPDIKVKTSKTCVSILRADPDDPSVITLSTSTIMRSRCMEIHFQPSKDILLSGDLRVNFDVAINGCVSLIRCAILQWVEHRGEPYSWEDTDICPFVIDWMKPILYDLNKLKDSNAYHTVTSAILLACCLYKLREFYSVSIPEDFGIRLLQAMSLSITDGEREFEFLRKKIEKSPEAKQTVVDALVYYLRTIITFQKPDNAIVIVKALPLYHFLCGFSVPNQQSFISLDDISWGDTSLMMEKLQSTLRFTKGFVQKYEKDIQQLIQFDSRLLLIIPYICPWEDTNLLSDMLPLDLAIIWLTERLGLHLKTRFARRSSIDHYKMIMCFRKPLLYIQKRMYEEEIVNFDVFVQCSDAANHLLKSFEGKNAKIILKSMVSLFLHIFYKVKTFGKCQEILCQVLTDSIRDTLKNFVSRKSGIIGGSFFGASLKYRYHGINYNQELRRVNDELEFWIEILSIEFPTNEMKEEIKALVCEIVNDRVSAIPSSELKIALFISIEQQTIPNFIRRIVFAEAIKALNIMFTNRGLILDFSGTEEVISEIIDLKFPNLCENDEMPLNDVLEWELWPEILKAYNGNNNSVSKLILVVVNKVETTCTSIYDGVITISDLDIIKSNQMQMKRLYEVIQESQTTGFQRSMEKRIKEFEQFKTYTMKLKCFLFQIGNVLAGQQELMHELEENYEDEKIHNICVTTFDGSCRVVCFPDARPLDPFLDGFFIISSEYSSDIFNKLWCKILNKQLTAVDSSKIYSFVLEPTIQSCTLLLKKLQLGDMSLLELDDLFKNVYFNNLDKLQDDLINLQRGVDTINNTITGDINWIKNAVVRIGQYWDLCGYREAAEAFLKIRDTLKLTGDFVKVETALKVLAGGIGTTLNLIDHSIVDAGKLFQEYANDPKKVQCLLAFAECQNIVEWMRKETKNLTNLATFVSSSVAGREGSMAADKLLFLYTVGSGFGPLIYKLSKDASYQKLDELCKTLWVTLETTPDLPDLLKSCEKDAVWYKSLKEKHKTKTH